MTEEEKKAAAEATRIAKEAADNAQAETDAKDANKDADLLALKDAEIAKLTEDRDNYKNVALKRLGKLPGDADFAAGTDGTELSVAEQVRIALMDNEINKAQTDKQREMDRVVKENSELRLALRNRPGEGPGSSGGSTVETKDNVFSPAQIETLRARAERLKADPEKFIEAAKKNLAAKA